MHGLAEALCEKIKTEGIDLSSLVSAAERPIYDKFDSYIPTDLLKKAFVTDRLSAEEILSFVAEKDGAPYIEKGSAPAPV